MREEAEMAPPPPLRRLGRSNSIRKNFHPGKRDWHRDIEKAARTGNWERVRSLLALADTYQQSHHTMGHDKKKKRFWQRKSGRVDVEGMGLLKQDAEGRTPLYLALVAQQTPNDVLLELIHTEPKAAAVSTARGRLPLHVAVLRQHHIEVIAELIEAYPAGISATDAKGFSPLGYAFDIAKHLTDLLQAPSTFWMPSPDGCEEAGWQEKQGERWGQVHWLLLSSATHPQTSLSVGGKKPMLVDALLHAAPPVVISLLIGASAMLLTHDNKATAFAGSTLYSCIARHYPLPILVSLANQCPHDVRTIRDETGMGLLAAQFISGCFEQIKNTEEWTVSPDFYASVQDVIETGDMSTDDAAFVDWWKKIQFLLVFCSGESPTKYLRDFLLHAALSTSDTPPIVVRMLLSLYPNAISLPDPSTGALPLHMAAIRDPYIPRIYENQIIGDDKVLDQILDADPAAKYERHERRLPLHYALAYGKTITDMEPLLDSRDRLLRQRDPHTGLYPFLQAATYQNNGQRDSFRWTCVARNKYPYSVWQGLSDRQRAQAVIRVVEAEETERVRTIYELLRRDPGVVEFSDPKAEPLNVVRDGSGMGMVAAHFMTWCYDEVKKGKWVTKVKNTESFRDAVRLASAGGDLTDMSPDFHEWWSKLKFWIRYCFPGKFGSDPAQDILVLPADDDKYLLHAALANSDTPPQVIEFLLSLYPESVSLPVVETNELPLHIISKTTSYTARPFEAIHGDSLELTLRAHPYAVRVVSNGKLPLHVAILSGKTWSEFECIVEEEPRALTYRDFETGLYPFQLMAIRREYTAEQRLRFQYTARNQQKYSVWKRLTPQERAKEFRRVQREHQLDVLSSIFQILRRDASVISGPLPCSAPENSVKVTMEALLVENGMAESPGELTVKSHSEDAGRVRRFEASEGSLSLASDIEGSGCCSSSMSRAHHDAAQQEQPKANPQTALMRLLSQSNHTKKKRDEDLFECDASVFSNVDVMSTISSSIHAKEHAKRSPGREHSKYGKRRISGSREGASFGEIDEVDQDDTENADEFGEDTEGESYEFAEDSVIFNSPARVDPSEASGEIESEIVEHSDDKSSTTDSSSLVLFQIRRKPRTSAWKEDSGIIPVRLSKKPDTSFSNHTSDEVPNASHRSSQTPISGLTSTSISQSAHSISSYTSLQPGGLKKVDNAWVSNKIYDSTLLESMEGSGDFDESLLLAANPAPILGNGCSQRNEREKSLHSNNSGISVLTPVDDLQDSFNGSKMDMMWISGGESSEMAAKADGPLEQQHHVLSTVDEEKVSPGKPPTAGRVLSSNHETMRQQGRQARHSTESDKPANSEPVEEIYFDKATMRWIKRPAKQDDIASTDENRGDYAQSSGEKRSRVVFDKKTMRWRTIEEIEEEYRSTKEQLKSPEMSNTQHDEVCESPYNLVKEKLKKPPSKGTAEAANPFVEVLSKDKNLQSNKAFSKAKHAASTNNPEDVEEVSKGDRSSIAFRSRMSMSMFRASSVRTSWAARFRSPDSRLKCLLCDKNGREVLMVPCRHLCICRHCSVHLKQIASCPLCEGPVTDRMLIF